VAGHGCSFFFSSGEAREDFRFAFGLKERRELVFFFWLLEAVKGQALFTRWSLDLSSLKDAHLRKVDFLPANNIKK
jgi:hypothetical protein